MAKSLNSIKWNDFYIRDIIDSINIAKSSDYGKLKKGNTVFVGRQETNNGIQGFVNISPNEVKNCITISMVATNMKAFWQKWDFATSQNILILRNQKYNSYSAKFICSVMNNYLLTKYGYGNVIKLSTFPKDKILLPVNSKGEPDYEFMEEYIKEREVKLKEQYKNHVKVRVEKLAKEIINDKEWKEFSIHSIFNTEKGNQNKMNSLEKGNLPLVSAKKFENGYKGFVQQNDKKVFKGNCLSLNNDGDGGAGISYYQPSVMLLDSHCTALIPKQKLNRYNLLFISRVITNQREKFGHGYAINSERLKSLKIMLPITSKGEPDYTYMENYMKYLEQRKILKYLEFI